MADTVTIAPVRQPDSEQSNALITNPGRKRSKSEAQKKVDMVTTQLRRSRLERLNLDATRMNKDSESRYAQFAGEFGDVFEQMYDNQNQQE